MGGKGPLNLGRKHLSRDRCALSEKIPGLCRQISVTSIVRRGWLSTGPKPPLGVVLRSLLGLKIDSNPRGQVGALTHIPTDGQTQRRSCSRQGFHSKK